VKLLLDTHVLVWATSDSGKLGRRSARAINDVRNELWLSPISILELANLSRRGRLRFDRIFDEWVTEALSKLTCKEAPFTFDVALDTRGLSMQHHDPADRIIAATARVFGLTLVTADEVLLAAVDVPTMAA
jgi:PIN domain nuclease of toxin-antitoxin system